MGSHDKKRGNALGDGYVTCLTILTISLCISISGHNVHFTYTIKILIICCIFFHETFSISLEYDAKSLTKSRKGVKESSSLERKKEA